MGKEMKRTDLEDQVVDSIAQRLSLLPDLRLPYSFSCRGDSVTQPERKLHLVDLLRRDAAVFLERHGSSLCCTELQEFEVLKEDYEVNWHLKQLKSAMNPTMEEQKAQAAVVKNRRLAFMDRLVEDGQYFSEDAMRMRAPLLHHEYLGKFQDPCERAFSRPGERWSDMLIRQAEEFEFQVRLKMEQEQAGLAEEEVEEDDDTEEDEEEPQNDTEHKRMMEDAQKMIEHNEREETQGMEFQFQARLSMKQSKAGFAEEEMEEEDDTDEDGDESGKDNAGQKMMKEGVNIEQAGVSQEDKIEHEEREETESVEPDFFLPFTREEEQQSKLENFTRYMQDKFLSGEDSNSFVPAISDEELLSKMDDFTRIMQEKFLSGEDSEYFDYSRIDHDIALDDHWLKEASLDAEEKYFEED